MKFELEINRGIIPGAYVRRVLEHFPELEESFEQRKQYDEYYYNTSYSVNIKSLKQLKEISESLGCFRLKGNIIELI